MRELILHHSDFNNRHVFREKPTVHWLNRRFCSNGVSNLRPTSEALRRISVREEQVVAEPVWVRYYLSSLLAHCLGSHFLPHH